MNKTDLIRAVSESVQLPKKDTELVINTFLENIISELAIGEKIILTGFGSFEVRERNPRQGVNPKTGERINIEGTKAPVFKAGAVLKDAVNK